jgi:class I fructose-bisphosphate aldolase
VAVDHFIGYQEGLPVGLADLPAALAAIVAGAPDAVTMHKGVALSCWGRYAGKVPLILQSIIGRPDDSANEHLCTPEDAVRLGADGFATCAFVRGPSEAGYLRRAGDFIRQAEAWDMPVIIHSYPRKYSGGRVEIVYTLEDIAWAVRCCLEAGADVIKTPYTGDPKSFGDIVRSCPVPIVAAGGPKARTLKAALESAAGVVAAGARGLTVGRNVWGFPEVTKAVLAFKYVIHDNMDPAQAIAKAGIHSEA